MQYFVSYYDYYQPEAFIPVTGTYIEKDLSINDELEKLRLSTTSALLSGRRDIIVISSVSCLYGIGNPVEFQKNVINLEAGQQISRTKLLHQLVQSLYSRTEAEFAAGNFRIKGDIVEIFPSYGDEPFRIHFFGDEIEEIESFDVKTSQVIEKFKRLTIYPANMFVTSPDVLQGAIWEIQQDLVKQVDYFKEIGEKYGPFDFAILENGQYNEAWKYIHALPTDLPAIINDLKAKHIIPVHAAKFALAKHAWDEPLEKIMTNGKQNKLDILTPMIGEPLNLNDSVFHFKEWWRD